MTAAAVSSQQLEAVTLTRGQKALVQKMIKSSLASHEEIKYYVFGFTATSVLNTGFVVPITQVTQGIAHNQRLGDRIRPVSLSLRFELVASANTLLAAADQWNSVRIIVFRWYDDSTPAFPVTNDILIAGTSTFRTLAPYNRSESPRYKILSDKVYKLENTPVWNGAATLYEIGPGSTRNVEMMFNGKIINHLMEFENSAITGSNQVFLLAVSDSSFTPHPQMSLDMELGFTDS